MNDKEKVNQQLKEAYALNEKLERGEVGLLSPQLALANCKVWINTKAATTGSARTLRDVLLSLANQRSVNLSALRSLDPERRIWVASVVVGLSLLQDKELISAAGGLESD
jgi:ligand-binding sensor domain-containing protein